MLVCCFSAKTLVFRKRNNAKDQVVFRFVSFRACIAVPVPVPFRYRPFVCTRYTWWSSRATTYRREAEKSTVILINPFPASTSGVDSTSIPYSVGASRSNGGMSLVLLASTTPPADDRTILPCKSSTAQACWPGIGDVSGSKAAAGGDDAGRAGCCCCCG